MYTMNALNTEELRTLGERYGLAEYINTEFGVFAIPSREYGILLSSGKINEFITDNPTYVILGLYNINEYDNTKYYFLFDTSNEVASNNVIMYDYNRLGIKWWW